MINRSKIKYALKKNLPKLIFAAVLIVWQKIFINIVELVDSIRLRNFTKYKHLQLTHVGRTFSLGISPKNGFIDKHIFLYGIYEPFILDLVAKYLKNGDTFVDIGANIGQHSMFAASLVGDKGKVFSFEPIPRIYNQLLDSVKVNHYEHIVTVFNTALGEKDSTETLHIVPENIGGSSIVETEHSNEKITITLKKGDDILSTLEHIHLIKIDVEGYEYEVLKGIEETLQRTKPTIILEFSGEIYNKQGNNGNKIMSLLQNIGYTLYDIEDDMKKITNIHHFVSLFPKEKRQTNLLCLQEK